MPAITLLILLLSSCENNETRPIDIKGTIKGSFDTIDEFGNAVDDKMNITVELEGTDPLLYTESNAEGHFELTNIPMGTYNLIISKEGYGEVQSQGIQIVGGNEPIFTEGYLIQKSSTKISSLALELNDTGELYLNGTIQHRNPKSRAFMRIFLHKEEDPSNLNYLSSISFMIYGESGTSFNLNLGSYYSSGAFGSKVYVVAYGESDYSNGYYDILSKQYIYTTLGEASNVASIEIN